MVAPDNGMFFSGRSLVSMTCAAYGSPQPIIRWTHQNDLDIVPSNITNVHVTTVQDSDGDNIFVVSTLEYCGELGREPISCIAENGVSLESGDNRTVSVDFITYPTSEEEIIITVVLKIEVTSIIIKLVPRPSPLI